VKWQRKLSWSRRWNTTLVLLKS